MAFMYACTAKRCGLTSPPADEVCEMQQAAREAGWRFWVDDETMRPGEALCPQHALVYAPPQAGEPATKERP